MSPSSETLWTRSAGRPPDSLPLRDRTRCDVAVVGAGILGVSLALHAAESGASVVLLEAEDVGAGASGVNAGRVMPDFVRNDLASIRKALGRRRGEALAQEIAGAADLVFDLVERHAIVCDARRSGWLLGAHARSRRAALRRKRDDWSGLGRALHLIEAEEARVLSGCRFHAGLIDPSAGHLNPLSYVRGLAQAAMAAGVALHTRSPVTQVTRTDRRWRLLTAAGEVEAEQAFLCVNGKTGTLAPEVQRSVLDLSVYEMATGPLDREQLDAVLPQRHMVSDTRNTVFAYHLDEAGRLLTGAITVPRLKARWRVEQEGLRHIRTRLGLAVPQIRHLWHGSATRAPDSRPHIYQVAPGLWAPMACNGRGIASCTVVGRLCARLAAGDAAVPLQPEPPLPIPLHGVASRLHGPLIVLSALQDHLVP